MPCFTINGLKPTRLLYSAGEHACIKEGHGFKEAFQLPLLPTGLIDLSVLKAFLEEDVPTVITIQAANSETGVIQPIQEIAALANHFNAIFLCDVVQAIGKMPLHELIGADALLLSAHKFGGLKGIGALVITSPRIALNETFIKGGGQEARRRSGTENLSGIVSFSAALKATLEGFKEELNHLKTLQKSFEKGLENLVVAHNSPRLANTTTLILPSLKAETALIKLDLQGISISSGSACSSGKVKASDTLLAMGLAEEEAARALRISFYHGNTLEEAERLRQAIKQL